MLERLARFSVRRRWRVVAVWLVALVGMGGLAATVGGTTADNFNVPGTESQRAFDILEKRFPARAGDSFQIVFSSDRGLDDPDVEAQVKDALKRFEGLDYVTEIESPYAAAANIAQKGERAGDVGFATAQLDRRASTLPTSWGDEVLDARAQANSEDLQVELGGAAIQFAVREPPGGTAELIGLGAAVVILLLTFGSVIAMGLPILTALFGLGVGLSALALVENFVDVVEVAPAIAVMIGIGVGIDYALFIVTRYRNGLHSGLSVENAIAVAVTTAGRAVIFAGFTVVISLGGLFFVGLSLVNGIAIAAMLTVAFAVLTSITLLPAVLGAIGHRIDHWRVPGLHRDESAHRETLWFRWSRFLQRRPWPPAIAALVVLIVLAIPAFSLRLGSQDAGTDPTSQTTRQAYDLLAQGFGSGFNGPFLVAASFSENGDLAAVEELHERIASAPGVAEVAPVVPNTDAEGNADAAVMTVFPSTSPQSVETEDLLNRLRDEVIPQSIRGTSIEVDIGGPTAVFVDLGKVLGDRLPLFMGGVLVLSFILLLCAFRSVVVPAKAVVMNLLSIGASFGIVVAVFQWGWFNELVGLDKTIPIPSFAPMMLFAVVFGLSMDYEVFLISRVHEEYLRTGDNSLSVADGLASTARVITAAASIMIMVFGAFLLDADPILKLFGLGLASAILIDATIVRVVLVPATMELLEDFNWWIPRWLDRIVPHISIEGDSVVAPVGAETSGDDTDPDSDPDLLEETAKV